MSENAGFGKIFFVFGFLALLLAGASPAAALGAHDDLQLSFLTPQYFPYDASDSTTKGNALMISSTLSNPFGASVGAAPGNNVNRIYLIISNAAGRATVGDVYFYQNGYYRKMPRTADTSVGVTVDYVYATGSGILPVLQTARIKFNPYNGENGNPDYSDFVLEITEKTNAQGTTQGAWLFDVGGINSYNPYFYDETSDTAFNGMIWYSLNGGTPQAHASPYTSLRGSVGTQQARSATVEYAIEVASPTATPAPTATLTASPSSGVGPLKVTLTARFTGDLRGATWAGFYCYVGDQERAANINYGTERPYAVYECSYPRVSQTTVHDASVGVGGTGLPGGFLATAHASVTVYAQTQTPTPTVPPECKTTIEFMQVGQAVVHVPTNYKIVLKDISGMPYGTSYSPAATFDVFNSNGNKIDMATLQKAGSGGASEYNKNGVRFGVLNVFVGTGGSAYAYAYFCPQALLETNATPIPTPTQAPSPTPYPVRIISIDSSAAMWDPGCNARAQGAARNLVSFRRDWKDCRTGAVIERQLIYTNGGYCNVKCANRYREHCVDDGTPDTYYDEFECVYAAPTITPTATPTLAACTADVKQCPDGSYVSRVPPYCNFADCRTQPTATPNPNPSKCELDDVVLSEGQIVSTCGFTVSVVKQGEWRNSMTYSVNGQNYQAEVDYQSTHTTVEGGPALFVFFGNRFETGKGSFKQIKPFEKYYAALAPGQQVALADGTRITLSSASATSDGVGTAVFSVLPASSDVPYVVSINTNEEKTVGSATAFVFAVRNNAANGVVTIGFTPSTTQTLAVGTLAPEPNGIHVLTQLAYSAGLKPFYRTVRDCPTQRPVGDKQLIPGYGSCGSNHYQGQCISDGSFDVYYDDSENGVCDNTNWPIPTTTVTEIPPFPTTEPNTRTIKLRAGWNMIGTPVTGNHALGGLLPAFRTGGKIVKTSCAAATLWNWNPATRSYETPGKTVEGTILEPSKGYWAYAASDCALAIHGDSPVTLEGVRLYDGWNQISGPTHPVSFNSISRACTVLSGPWRFNSAAQKYEKAGALQSGEGYFVRVKGECALAETDYSMPPALPNDYDRENERAASDSASSGGSSGRSSNARTRTADAAAD